MDLRALGKTSLFVSALVVVAVLRLPTARAAPPTWRELLRHELASHLSPAEVERLLASRFATETFDELFAGWDGEADHVSIRKTLDGLVIETSIGDRRCMTPLARSEAPIAAPICDDIPRPDGRRSATFSPDVWTPPPRPRPKRPSAIVDARPPEPPTPARAPSVLDGSGTAHAADAPPEPLAAIRAEHEDFKDRVRRPSFKDPLLPADPVEAGDAFTPLDWEPIVQTATDFNLKNPFSESRMRTADPMPNPALTALGTSLDAPPTLPGPREECDDEWALRELTPDPPTLDCYRRVAFHARLGKKGLHRALGPLASILQVPGVNALLAAEMQSAVTPRSHGPVWAMIWIEWVQRRPERMADATQRLTPEERRLLRRRLASWWVDPGFVTWRATITELLEHHFVALYPESKDIDGLPRRGFVTDTWLWANNWLAGVDPRAEPAITAAYERLAPAERKVIDTLLADRAFSARYLRVAEVLARY